MIVYSFSGILGVVIDYGREGLEGKLKILNKISQPNNKIIFIAHPTVTID